jgi:hypothetical protein
MKNLTFPDRVWVEFESDAGPMTGMTARLKGADHD